MKFFIRIEEKKREQALKRTRRVFEELFSSFSDFFFSFSRHIILWDHFSKIRHYIILWDQKLKPLYIILWDHFFRSAYLTPLSILWDQFLQAVLKTSLYYIMGSKIII